MSAQILDGKSISAQIRSKVKQQVDEMLAQGQRPPGLAVVLVGENPASEVYVRNKRNACEQVGFKSELIQLPAETSEEALLQLDRRPEPARGYGRHPGATASTGSNQ